MIHTIAKEYHWSKEEIDQVYPEEAILYLKMIAYDKQDEALRKKADYIQSCLDKLHIAHGDPNEVQSKFIVGLQKLQTLKITLLRDTNTEERNEVTEDELPDLEALARLKQFHAKHNARG
jgi:hypothetical protein